MKTLFKKSYKLFKYIKKAIGPYPEQTFFNYIKNGFVFGCFENPYRLLWVNPHDIQYILNRKFEKSLYWGLNNIIDGDWDKKVHDISKSNRHVAVFQHFKRGIPWCETQLFVKEYRHIFNKQRRAMGCYSYNELENFYNTKQVALYESLKNNGFQLPSPKGQNLEYLYVYIGRNGEFIYTGCGNHRLAMAKLLGIDKIPVRVWARHKKWQEIRLKTRKNIAGGTNMSSSHPDMRF